MGKWGRRTVVAVLVATAPIGTALAQVASRSAQGDCTREVESRGFRVLSTGNFQQFKDGWQLDVRARDRSGRDVNGSCFVETRSGDVTLFGFGWGGGEPAERYVFACGSPDNRYRECQLPVDGRARLVKRKSDAPCVEGRSWGQRGDRVWVNDGCRGKFEVVRGGGGSGEQIDCRSQNDRYQECVLRKGYDARIVRDYTGRCRRDSTWGTRTGVLWVTNGCQGRFQLVPATGGSGGSGSGNLNPGQQQRAESQCRNEASRQGIEVRFVSPATFQGSYWSATVAGRLRGQNVQATCRYYPAGNRAEIRF